VRVVDLGYGFQQTFDDVEFIEERELDRDVRQIRFANFAPGRVRTGDSARNR
jgi:hypothetical protein